MVKRNILPFFNQIRFKIFLISSILPLTAALTLGFIVFHYSITIITNNEYERIQMLAKRTDDQLNQYLYDMRMAFSLLSSDIVRNGSTLTHADIVKVLEQYKFGSASFWQEVYYISNDLTKYPSLGTKDPPQNKLKQIVDETVQDNTNLFSIGPYLDAAKGLTFSLSRMVRIGADINGVLVADVNLSNLNDSIAKINFDRHISMILYNKQYDPVLTDIKMTSDKYSHLMPVLKAWLQDKEHTRGFIEVKETHTRYLVTRSFIGFNDFSLVYFVDENSFLSKVNDLRSFASYLAIICSLVMIVLSLHLSGYINKPITKMIRDMEKVKRGNLQTRIQFSRNDEFLTLSNSFNDMLNQIETLIEEKSQVEVMKKQFELKALQAQINPHFLYNTLNSINALLDLKRTEQIPVIVHSLVRLFQYTMDKQGEWVPVETELTGLQYYVELQQIRYANKFRVEYHLSEELLKLGILKLTLQPIVENCIFHGIKGKRKQGIIKIGGDVLPDRSSVMLYIEDNGVGIPPERIITLLEQVDQTTLTKLAGYNSIGLKNVHDRLQLHFGPEFGLKIRSEVNKGTRVEIHYPVVFPNRSERE
ncbi:two-component system, sensor histidine kinase YesM [Paenibacillus sp. 1_12]|nr:two-component system, sensor histidine kinase YesM [Paenibacillus sp. 1_12]